MAKLKGKIHELYKNIFGDVPELTHFNDIQTYKQMSNDVIINAVLNAVRTPINEATYSIQEPNDASPTEKLITKFIDYFLLQKFDFKRLIKSATKGSQIYGFQVFEIGMKPMFINRRMYALPYRIIPLPARTIQEEIGARDEIGDIKYLTQVINGQRTNIRRDKLLIISTNSESIADWRGESPLRPVYKAWFMKNNFWLLQGQTIERWGPGLGVLTLPPNEAQNYGEFQEEDEDTNSSPSELDEAKDSAEVQMKAVADGDASYLVLQNGYEFRIAERSGQLPDISQVIRQIEDSIYTSFLAPHLKLGGSGGSSNALAVTLSDQFINLVEGKAREIVDSINTDLIEMIVNMNFPQQVRYPKLVVNNINKSTASKLFATLQYLPALANSPDVIQLAMGNLGLNIDTKGAQELIDMQNNKQPQLATTYK